MFSVMFFNYEYNKYIKITDKKKDKIILYKHYKQYIILLYYTLYAEYKLQPLNDY